VVRSRVPGETGPSGGPALTDAVGIVETDDERVVVVRRRDGSTRSIAREDILVVKPVPPAPPRRQPRSPREDPD
jgi:N-acetylglutamate synthase